MKSLDSYDEIDFDEVYNFGIYLLTLKFVYFISVLILSYLSNKVDLAILFMVTFSNLRKFTGGMHLKNQKICMIISIIISFIALQGVTFSFVFLYSLNILSSIIILLYAPITPINKSIKINDYVYYRKKSLRITIILQILIFILYLLGSVTYAKILLISVICTAVLMMCSDECNNILSLRGKIQFWESNRQ